MEKLLEYEKEIFNQQKNLLLDEILCEKEKSQKLKQKMTLKKFEPIKINKTTKDCNKST